MDAAALHASFLKHLFATCRPAAAPPASAIRLVARIVDPVRLGAVGERWLTLFLPDLHLISARAQQAFRYGFELLEPGRPVARAPLLRAVLDAGQRFFAENWPRANIATYQLGDFVDLWREGEFDNGITLPILVRQVREHMPWLWPRLVAKGTQSLFADLVAGNHDRGLDTVVSRTRDAHAPSFGHADRRTPVLITHGDVTDPVETTLQDPAQARFVRFGRDAKDHAYSAVEANVPSVAGSSPPREVTGPDFAAVPSVVNVRRVGLNASADAMAAAHEQLAGRSSSRFANLLLAPMDGWLTAVPQLRSGTGSTWAALSKTGNLPPALPGLKLVVVGHSHHARMVSVGEPADPDSFLLMDCGAWVERLQWPGGTVLASCQIGVLCGTDARIYQLDPPG